MQHPDAHSDDWEALRLLAEKQAPKNGEDEPPEDGVPPAGDLEEPPQAKQEPWPAPMAPEAFHGIAGDFVETVEPHTEADPAALLGQFLVASGNVIGRGPVFRVEATEHRCNLFLGLVGRTSKGRKGTGNDQVRRPLRLVDSTWDKDRIHSGLSSGEGVIWAVRDEVTRQEPIREKKMISGYQTVVVDEGIVDKRLLVVESELAGALCSIARQGNTLSPVIRNAWDRGDLQGMTKNSPARATGAYVSIIGHVTRDELRATLTATETANGFANRFLWICSKRSKVLPEGGHVPEGELFAIADRLRAVIEMASRPTLYQRDDAARAAWARVYPDLSEGEPGLYGAATNRAEAQVLRLSLLYAVLDGATSIGLSHLGAALAVWKYAEASARYIFGDAIGDEVADVIDQELRKVGDAGMTRTEINRTDHSRDPAARGVPAGTLREDPDLRETRRAVVLHGGDVRP